MTGKLIRTPIGPLITVVTLAVIALLAACEAAPEPLATQSDGPSSASEATSAIVPTATSVAEPTPTTEPSATPTPAPQPTATATPVAEPTPSPEPAPTPTIATTKRPPSPDREALETLFHATDGPNWRRNDNWLSDKPIGEWFGVRTNSEGRVTELVLYDVSGRSSNRLDGELPPELGSLSELQYLIIPGTGLRGPIPPELGNLTELRELNLQNNWLTGSIPPELGNLSKLESLSLYRNPLEGEIPRELGNLSSLKRLSIGSYSADRGRKPLGLLTGCLPGDLSQAVPEGRRSSLGLPPCDGPESAGIVVDAEGEPQIYNDNIFVLPAGGTKLTDGMPNTFDHLGDFYQRFHDAFDFVIIIANLQPLESLLHEGYFNPTYISVSNNVAGIGQPIWSRAQRTGSSGKLQGEIYLPHPSYASGSSRVLLHELMHRWGNSLIPTTASGHWGFSSAYGMIGGFDIANLADLGGGKFTVTEGWRGGGSFGFPEVYSPIELYVAGLLPPDEVPDLWVAPDVTLQPRQGGGYVRTDDGHLIFEPSEVLTITIEDIIAEHGQRVPDWQDSQREFRAAVILMVDADHPAYGYQLEHLSRGVAKFSFPGTDDDDYVNFYEATGGRATIITDGLTRFLKSESD